jgi:hypothetical protein
LHLSVLGGTKLYRENSRYTEVPTE